MKKVAVLLLLCSSYVFGSGKAFNHVGKCGEHRAFRNQCGNTARQAGPSSPANISATGFTISSPGNYQVTQNLGTGTETIISISNDNVIIWLQGFTLNGRIVCTSTCDHLKIYDGIVNCAIPDSVTIGCIDLSHGGGGSGGTVTISYITGTNTANIAADNSRWLNFDYSPAATGPLNIVIDHLDISMTNTGGASRVANFNFNVPTNVSMTMTNTKSTCGANTATCQGTQCFGSGSCFFYNNYGNLQQDLVPSDTARFIAWDTVSAGEAAYNDIDVNNSRAFRARDAVNAPVISIHNNLLWNGNGDPANSSAMTHFGDPDTGNDTAWKIYLYNNQFEITGDGIAMWGRDLDNFFMYDNNVICNGCTSTAEFVLLRDPAGNGSGTLTKGRFWNNHGITGNGWTKENEVTNGAVMTQCNTGSVTTSGTGSSVTISPCP